MKSPLMQELLNNELTKRLIDDGRYVEAGWAMFSMLFLPAEAGEKQRLMMRIAFFSGAQHVFGGAIMAVTGDDNDEPTNDDMARMSSINDELIEFIGQLETMRKAFKMGFPEGSA